jgi:hypothetical protein
MPPNLRLSLSIFAAGFGVEAVGDGYRLATGTVHLLAGTALLAVSALSTVFGLLFLWLGRHEWNELHRTRVGYTNATFFATIVLVALAVAPAAYLVARGEPLPSWLASEVGAAVAAALVATFLTYVWVVLHLVTRAVGFGLVAAPLAAIPVGYLVGSVLATQLPMYLPRVSSQPLGLAGLADPVAQPLAWLVVPYALLFVAFVDAHRRVARGLEPVGATG